MAKTVRTTIGYSRLVALPEYENIRIERADTIELSNSDNMEEEISVVKKRIQKWILKEVKELK